MSESGMEKMNWIRVTRQRRCPVCDHDGWCSFTGDGRSVKCMRVQSDKPTSNGGWMHRLDAPLPKQEITKRSHVTTFLDCDRMLANWRQSQNGQLEPFAATLGVSRMALESLGCVWASDHRAFAFPMRDAKGRVIGIRLRNDLGRKWAVRGSKQGLFLNLTAVRGGGQTLLIVEGPTDAAAAIDLGFPVIGRPACLGCEDMIAEIVRKGSHVNTFIVADADEPGQRGAERLKAKLPRAKIITLPCKDLRRFVNDGGNRIIFEQLLNAVV